MAVRLNFNEPFDVFYWLTEWIHRTFRRRWHGDGRSHTHTHTQRTTNCLKQTKTKRSLHSSGRCKSFHHSHTRSRGMRRNIVTVNLMQISFSLLSMASRTANNTVLFTACYHYCYCCYWQRVICSSRSLLQNSLPVFPVFVIFMKAHSHARTTDNVAVKSELATRPYKCIADSRKRFSIFLRRTHTFPSNISFAAAMIGYLTSTSVWHSVETRAGNTCTQQS